MDMPKPGPEHAKLQKLVGTWTGDEKLHPAPWDPHGGPAKGKAVNRVALDGYCVVQDYEQTRNGAVSFKGHGIFAWDAAGQCVSMYWVDSMMGIPALYTGNFQGDVLTLSNIGPQGHSRCTFDLSGGGYKFKLDVSPDGKQWFPFLEGSYRK